VENDIKPKLNNAALQCEGDEIELELADIINAPAIQSMMDDFFKLTNIGIGIIDLNGKILVATGWQDVCTKFHRVHPETLRHCRESDNVLSNGIEPGTFRLYQCKNNMWDMSTPIIIGNKRMGNLFLGQFFFADESPDYDMYRSQARRYGFNEKEYLKAIAKAPRWSREKVHSVMSYYTKFARMISELIYNNIRLTRTLKERDTLVNSLRGSEERYRVLFQFSPIQSIVVDNDGKIVMYNFAKQKSKGRLPNAGDVMYKDYAGKHQINMFEELKECIRSGQPKEFPELKYEEKYLHIKISPFSEGAIISSIDITEKKIIYDQLQQSQRLEAIGILAGGIAHDFNNILTTILGNISIAKMGIEKEDELYELLSDAEEASVRAQNLTGQLVTFAKGGAPVKETASIEALVKESSQYVLRGSKSECELCIGQDLWTAEVDIVQINQVISNIVLNASQAMPDGGVIRIAADNLFLEKSSGMSLKPGRYIRISIADQGVGITEKDISKIFDPYFTTRHMGSGLGLAVTYSIVKKHGGHITVESGPGSGTTFYIYLPASDKIVRTVNQEKPIKGRGRILIMDDEVALTKTVKRLLEKLGYESEGAKDGNEAIQLFKKAKASGKPYDAVILDLTIPGGIGGKEVIKQLLEIDADVKAIVSSGYSTDPVLSNYQEHGFKGVLTKPFRSLSLGTVLQDVLRGD
jgi:signal transduction histidine kinase/CheY-like chemotaxis protein/ligand-binding sensor protein